MRSWDITFTWPTQKFHHKWKKVVICRKTHYSLTLHQVDHNFTTNLHHQSQDNGVKETKTAFRGRHWANSGRHGANDFNVNEKNKLRRFTHCVCKKTRQQTNEWHLEDIDNVTESMPSLIENTNNFSWEQTLAMEDHTKDEKWSITSLILKFGGEQEILVSIDMERS